MSGSLPPSLPACLCVRTDLPIPVAESQTHHEALERVQEQICVFVGGHQIAAAGVYPVTKNLAFYGLFIAYSSPVESEEPLQTKERDQDGAGSHRLSKVGRLVGVGSSQLRHQNKENVEEEEDISCDTEEARKVGDPLHPDLVGGLCPAHPVLVVQPHHAVQQGRQHGNSWQTK